MNYLIMVCVLLFSAMSHAAIYKQVDQTTGKVTYSDMPLSSNAETIDVSNVPSQITTPPPSAPTLLKTSAPSQSAYKSFGIVSPTDQQTFQNQPIIPLITKSEPILSPNDKIQVLLDGKLFGAPMPSNTINLNNIERGSHTLSAAIVDQSQRVIIESAPITIFVHQGSVNQPSRQQQRIPPPAP